MTLSELTLPYRERIAANLRKSLDIQDWISDHPDLHPDERVAQFALCRALEQQNEQIQEQWEAASDQWLRTRTGQMTRVAEPLEEIVRDVKRRVE